MKKETITFSLLTEGDEPSLIVAIKEIMEENDAHNVMHFNLDAWKWQNKQLPGGRSLVYVGKNQEDKIMAYYHVPLYKGKKAGGENVWYAMIQDVAVSNQLRGHGIFKEIASFANKDLDEKNIEVVYTFPNIKSIHTFLKYNGFSKINTLPTFILPFNTALIIKSKINIPLLANILGFVVDKTVSFFPKKFKNKGSLLSHTSITPEILKVYDSFSKTYEYGLIKDQAYLHWRFLEKSGYFIVSIDEQLTGNIVAVAVFKKDIILKIPCLVLMDFAYMNDKQTFLLDLLSKIKKNQKSLFGEEFAMMFTSCNAAISTNLHKAGFLKIPDKRNPRPLNLLIRSSLPEKDTAEKRNWNITLCDWDVF